MPTPQLKQFDIQNFKGLSTSIQSPPADTALLLQNFMRNKKRGTLQLSDGYTTKFSALPGNDTIKKISNFRIIDFHDFYVPDHGGQDLTVIIATYTKSAFTTDGQTIDRFGIWVSHWWNGTSWIQQWMELTEMYIFKVIGETGNRILVDDGTLGVNGYFANNYFNGWTIVFDDNATYGFSSANDANNYLYVTQSTISPANLSYFGDGTPTGRPNGSKLYCYRNLYMQELPASISSYIYGLLNEIRITTGNTNYGLANMRNDLPIMVGYRKKNWGWTDPAGNDNGGANSVDRLVSESSGLKAWNRAFLHRLPILQLDTLDPLPASSYWIKETVMDDVGNETTLRDGFSESSGFKGLREIGTGILAVNQFGYVFADSNYVYSIKPQNDPCQIFRFNKTDLTFKESLTFVETGQMRAFALANGILYVSLTAAKVVKVDLSTFKEISNVSSTYTWTAMAVGTNYLIGISQSSVSPNKTSVERVLLSSFTYVDLHDITNEQYDVFIFSAGYFWLLGSGVSGLNDVFQISDTSSWTIQDRTPSSSTGGIALSAAVLNNTLFIISVNDMTRIYYMSLPVGSWSSFPSNAIGEVLTSIRTDGTVLYGFGTSHIFISDMTHNLFSWTLPPDYHNAIENPFYFNSVFYGFSEWGDNNGAITATEILNTFSIYVPLNNSIQLTLQISPSTLPKRARYINIYLSKDNSIWYFVKQVGLYSGEATWNSSATFDSYVKHNYIVMSTPITVRGSDWQSGVEASIQRGADPADDGIIQYTQGTVVGNKHYAVNVRYHGTLYPNQIFVCAINGDGATSWDIFPNDPNHEINLEYSDGDQLVALGSINDMILVMKQRSLVLLTGPDSSGSYSRQIVSKSVGLVAPYAFSCYDDKIYLVGDSAIAEFSTTSFEVINLSLIQDWRNLSLIIKQNAKCVIDRKNRQWRISVNNIIYSLDLDDGEWMQDVFPDVPIKFSTQFTGIVDFISTSNLFYQNSAILFNNTNISCFWISNRQELAEGLAYDALLQSCYTYINSQVSVIFNIFADDNISTPVGSFLIPAGKTYASFLLPLSTRCKAIRIGIQTTVTANNKSVQISRAGIYYQLIPAYGDVMVQ